MSSLLSTGDIKQILQGVWFFLQVGVLAVPKDLGRAGDGGRSMKRGGQCEL